GVAQDAGVVHQAVDATEILHDLVEGGDHLIFFSNVADIGAGVATGLLAQLHGFIELVLAQVDQRQLGTLSGQKSCHATAQTLSAAGDGDHCIFEIHTDPSLRLTRVDRKSTRLNSSHVKISYAVFSLKKKTRSETNSELLFSLFAKKITPHMVLIST